MSKTTYDQNSKVVPLWQARGHAVALSHLQPEGPFDSCGRGERSQPSSCQ